MTDTYRIRSPETWDQARKDYLAGDTAEQVCARYDLGLSNFHRRANADGWRRIDQPDPEPLDRDDDADDLPEADLLVIADLAQCRMAQSVRRGRVVEALRWQKLHQLLSTQIARQAQTDRQADAARTRTEELKAHDARIDAALPPNATPLQRVEAELRAMMNGYDSPGLLDDLDELESLEGLQSLSTITPADAFSDWPSTILSQALVDAKTATSVSNRAQRRRVEKQRRKRE